MKRSLILLGAVAATLASCSKSEVVDVNDSKAIGFETFVNKSTRAVGNDEGRTSDNLLEFYVYGGSEQSPNLFTGDKVSRNSTSDPWKYENTKYWFKNRTYKFAAINPGAGANLSANFDYGNNGHMELTATLNGTSQYDLVYGEASKTTQEDLSNVGTVSFSLGHILSKIRILFEKNEDFGTETQLLITNLKLEGANTTQGSGIFSQGVYKYENDWSWTEVTSGSTDAVFTTSTTYTVTDASITGTLPAVEEVGQTFYVIPQTPDQGVKLSFTVQLQEKTEEDTWANVGASQDLSKTIPTGQAAWTSNSIYTYKVKISNAGLPGEDRFAIDFSASVSDWGSKDNQSDVTIE